MLLLLMDGATSIKKRIIIHSTWKMRSREKVRATDEFVGGEILLWVKNGSCVLIHASTCPSLFIFVIMDFAMVCSD